MYNDKKQEMLNAKNRLILFLKMSKKTFFLLTLTSVYGKMNKYIQNDKVAWHSRFGAHWSAYITLTMRV